MLKIVIDNREQAPFAFAGYDCQTEPGTLTTGDYSIPGFSDCVAVERKSLSDLIGCLTSGRERFTRELERLRGYDAAAVVIEAGFSDLAAGRYRSRLNPEAARQSVYSMMAAYRIPFFFAGNRKEAERFTFDFLRHYARHAAARYKAIARLPE